jgi:hypothetical protein
LLVGQRRGGDGNGHAPGGDSEQAAHPPKNTPFITRLQNPYWVLAAVGSCPAHARVGWTELAVVFHWISGFGGRRL